MTSAPVCTPAVRWTGGFPGVGLDEVLERAELLDRCDRKYLLDVADLEALVDSLPGGLRVLEIDGRRAFRYRSLYFDTPDLRSYRDAAHGRPRRWKLRTRTYLDSGESWLELKLRDRRGRTVKHRRPRRVDAPAALEPVERSFADDLVGVAGLANVLRPTLTTSYARVTLLDPAAASRITVDLALRSRLADGRQIALPGQAIVETKSAGRAGAADRALWSLGRRPLRLSKYATSLAAACPELPANRWHRTLGHVAFQPQAPDLRWGHR
ncbi:MAG: polyphosphate polymerase domain-containing protein [Ilumatobacteraceae bacterium]